MVIIRTVAFTLHEMRWLSIILNKVMTYKYVFLNQIYLAAMMSGERVNAGKTITKLLQCPGGIDYSGCSSNGEKQLILFEKVEQKKILFKGERSLG